MTTKSEKNIKNSLINNLKTGPNKLQTNPVVCKVYKRPIYPLSVLAYNSLQWQLYLYGHLLHRLQSIGVKTVPYQLSLFDEDSQVLIGQNSFEELVLG